MPDEPTAARGILFWDMAGTLLGRDIVTGRIRALPGSDEALALLSDRYIHHLTTSDITEHARALLQDVGLLQSFSGVHGNFARRTGKSYGAIAADLGVPPECCLAIGDYLPGDLPADTERLVTVLVNQRDFTLHASVIVALADLLATHGADNFTAFENLLAGAEHMTGADLPLWRREDDFEYFLTWYEHTTLNGRRPLIILPG